VVHVARIIFNRNTHRNLVDNPEGKKSLEKNKLGLEDNIKMHVNKKYVGSWIGLMWLRIRKSDGRLRTL
jgi:hypothetical protein